LPIRVVGCGSPRGDDAVAWEVIRQLGDSGLAAGVELHVVEGGDQLLDRLDGRGTLVLIDAISSGARPGSIHRFDWPGLPIESLRPGSTHDLGPGEALRLAATLGLLPPQATVWGIEAKCFGPQTWPMRTDASSTLTRSASEGDFDEALRRRIGLVSGETFTPEVAAAVPELVRRIVHELGTSRAEPFRMCADVQRSDTMPWHSGG
jgi:hydrogenase maturation protease